MSYLGFAALKAQVISTIKTSSYVLASNVYDYAEAQLQGYPSVLVFSAGMDGKFADTARDEYHFHFTILCLQERLVAGDETAEQNLTNLVDDIIQKINANVTLNNQSNTFTRPVGVKWGYQKVQDAEVRVAQLELEVVVGQ